MRTYKWSFYITGIITILALAAAIILNYYYESQNSLFWCNVALGVFGSGLLSFIVSIIGYNSEKRSTLEDFYFNTLHLLHFLDRYSPHWNRNEKIDFYLQFLDIDRTAWDTDVGKMSFILNHKETYEYIYSKIYKPLFDFTDKIYRQSIDMRRYKLRKGNNNERIDRIIQEVEDIMIEYITIKTSDNIDFELHQNKIVASIADEFKGRYRQLMYGTNSKNIPAKTSDAEKDIEKIA